MRPGPDVTARFRAALASVSPLPLPAHGATPDRFARLARVARDDLAVARLVEGDADARAILAECGRVPDDDATYGVWAARSPGAANATSAALGTSPVGHPISPGIHEF